MSTPAYAPNVEGRLGNINDLRRQAEREHLGWALPYLSEGYQFLVGDAIDTLCDPHASATAKAWAAATILPWGKILKVLNFASKIRLFRSAANAAEVAAKDPKSIAIKTSVADKLQVYLLNPNHKVGAQKPSGSRKH